jgi:hypothetical protein
MIEKKNVTGTAALNYVKRELSKGGVLSTCISSLPLVKGSIYALVPAETSDVNLYDFENGVLYPFDEKLLDAKQPAIPIQNEARPFLVEIVQQYLNVSETNCCLFEDPIRLPTDPKVTDSAIDYVHLIGGEMFYFFNSSSNDSSKINKALMTSEAYIFLCALSSLGTVKQNAFLTKKEIDLELLKLFTAGVSSFFVKAYDYEGYLMWVGEE